MALKGLPPDFLIPFVPESEKEEEEKDRTIFWIRPKDARAANKALGMMSGVMQQKRQGITKINPHKFTAAELDLWTDMIDHIDNFVFSEDLEADKVTKKIESGELIGRVYRQLSSTTIQEVFDAAEDNVLLTEALKKGSTS